jgi:hypothetical protein
MKTPDKSQDHRPPLRGACSLGGHKKTVKDGLVDYLMQYRATLSCEAVGTRLLMNRHNVIFAGRSPCQVARAVNSE